MLKFAVTSLFPNHLSVLHSSVGLRSARFVSATSIATRAVRDLSFRSARDKHSSASSTQAYLKMEPEHYTFGQYKIEHKEVFYTTELSYAFVNIRPVTPDVLVCPKRKVKRFVDMTADETSDLWITAKKIGGQLEHYHKASSLTFTIQDGPEAGQSVAHVHIHVLPRKAGDFENNDEIYEAINENDKELKKKLDLDKERKDRNPEEMAQEADEYRKLFL